MPLEVTFARLYASLARWRPSAERAASTCRLCLASQFSQAFALVHLPHDVTHSFLLQLDVLASQRLKELEDEFDAEKSAIDDGWFETIEDRAERIQGFAEQIDEEIWTEVARRTPEIEAARRRLIEPRLEAFLADEMIDLDLGPPDWLS